MTALSLLTDELRSKGSKTQYTSARQGSLYLGLRGLCTYAHAHVGESMNFPEGKRMDVGRGPAGLECPARARRAVSCPTSAPAGAQGSNPSRRAAVLSSDIGTIPTFSHPVIIMPQHSATKPELTASFKGRGPRCQDKSVPINSLGSRFLDDRKIPPRGHN